MIGMAEDAQDLPIGNSCRQRSCENAAAVTVVRLGEGGTASADADGRLGSLRV